MGSADLRAEVEALASRVREGDRAAVAAALNQVEDRRASARDATRALLDALGDGRANAMRVGITGPPGVGKSTLVGALARALRARGHTVGVLAVDPSSRRSGGALLGDRARIETDPADQGVFVRSLATAGELGGLARAAPSAALVLAAAFDWVLVETVGVGQSETDVEHVVDTVVFVVQPASGDALQFLKAGIMEIPDVIAVNKCDLESAARRARGDLRAALAGAHFETAWRPPVVLTSAAKRTGIDALLDAIVAHRAHLESTGELRERRVRGRVAWGLREFVRRVGEEGLARAGGEARVTAAIEAQVREGKSPLVDG